MEEYEVYFSDYTGTDEYIAFKGVYSNTYGDIALDNITIDDLQSCADPSDVNANEITQTSALMEWTENGDATQWRIEYGEMGFTPSGVAMIASDENPYLLQGLDAGTYYDFYVQADCGAGSVSAWIGPYYFSTLCAASTSIPYIENFEEVILPFMPSCNAVENTNNDDLNWISSDANAYNGNQHAMIEYSDTEQMNDWFFSPGIELLGGETYNVNFFYTSSSDAYYENLEVKFGTEPNAASMTSEVIFEDLMFALNNIYQPANASFTPDEDGIYYVGWHGFSEAGNGNILIDDINVDMNETSSGLEAPTNLIGPAEVEHGQDIMLSWETVSTPSANFFEGFEGDFLPEGWSKFNMDGGSGWMQVMVGEDVAGWSGGSITACPDGGQFQAYATWLTGGDPVSDQWLVTPQLTYSEGDTLGFWMGTYRDDYSEHIEIRISTTTPDNPEAFDIVVDIIDLPVGTPIGWIYYYYDLTSIVENGTPIYVAFRENVLDNYNEGNATSLDNISLRKAESKSSVKSLLGYNVYHKLNSNDFEKIGFTNDISFTHNTSDIGVHTYYVTSLYTEGESEPSNEHVVDVVLGVSEELALSTQIYPIPAKDYVNITSEYTMKSVIIYNQTGQKVQEMNVNAADYKVNTSKMVSGIYTILIDTEKGRIHKQLIIE
ncbi:T9SS type A sorting domain-containing protein [Lentimicrobium sp. L6]|nr:choice-of-anchor J domain-containing protein [Lentimicrobium sp. L6]NPD84116.1 T9SS type A sorting domain-containing protein [Lentimicrobium sp. L6]